jgi:CubicO group peptidase (beta-lactamase class C family)
MGGNMNTRSLWPFAARSSLVVYLRIALVSLLVGCSNQPKTVQVTPWPTSTPETQGMDSGRLVKLLDAIDQAKLDLHSFLVLRHGKLVMEVYYPPFGPQDKHVLHSATKGVLSALVGIAQQEGKIKSIAQPVVDFFPNASIANLSETKKKINLQNLLNMSSGLSPEDMSTSQNWMQFALNQPMQADPGTSSAFNPYWDGNPQLLSAVLQKTTGKTTLEYAQEKLFRPLGIQEVSWAADPGEVTEGGDGLMLTPADMAKFGTLYLNKGQWKGQQVIPPEWVDATLQMNKTGSGTLGGNSGYNYLWWQFQNGYATWGDGGQLIYIIPSKDIVVVSTGALSMDTISVPIYLIKSFVDGAVQSDTPLPDSPATKQLAERVRTIENSKAQDDVPALSATAQ